MSSPRGFDAGGMGEMGTEELRLDMRVGEGEWRRPPSSVTGEGGRDGDGDVRGKRKENGLKGNLDRSGGCRTFKNMLKFRSARLACGTYLGSDQRGSLMLE